MLGNTHGCGVLLLSTKCVNPTEHVWTSQIPDDVPHVLLVQRGFTAPTFPMYWGAPAGLCEVGETLAQTATREVWEETGVIVNPESLDRFYDGQWCSDVEVRDLTYFVGNWVAPPRLTLQKDEVAGSGWFLIKDALRLPLAFHYPDALVRLGQHLQCS